MRTQKSEKITSLSGFTEWVVQLEPKNYLFRGVSNREYEIGQASAYRRLDKKEQTLAKLIEINKSVIEQARRRGYDLKNGRALSDLEILCEMQHFRVATCLIDFSYSAEVSLWFACSSSSDEQDGKIVAVPNDHSIKEVTSETLDKSIDYFFKEDEMGEYPLYQWQPTHLNNRVIRQHSVFLFGGGEIRSPAECIIDAASKEKIRRELERFSNISEDTLFPDFEGFARLHTHNVPHTIPNYRRIASEAYQKDDYPKAIANYEEAIRVDPNDSWLYYMRGNANFGQKQYDDAIDDYDEAIRLNPEFSEAYHWRGRVKHLLEQYDDAIDDYDEATRLNSKFSEAYYWRGRVKHLLEQYDDAIDDYDEATRLDPNDLHAYRYRAKAKMKTGELAPAQPDLQLALLLAEKTGDAALIKEINEDISEVDKLLDDEIPF